MIGLHEELAAQEQQGKPVRIVSGRCGTDGNRCGRSGDHDEGIDVSRGGGHRCQAGTGSLSDR